MSANSEQIELLESALRLIRVSPVSASVLVSAVLEQMRGSVAPAAPAEPAEPAAPVQASKPHPTPKPEPEPQEQNTGYSHWAADEVGILKTCASEVDAVFVYQTHNPESPRTETAIRLKWRKLRLANLLLAVGQSVNIGGSGICAGKTGIIQSFTDDRQYANISLQSDPGIYQVEISSLSSVGEAS